MAIHIATHSDIDGWVEVRARLWGDTSRAQHRAEAAAMLANSPDGCITFLSIDNGRIRGFAEAALRYDHVNGCATSPVAFLEGIFVCREQRGRGVGRALLQAVQSWARARGCTELASDAHLDNVASHAFHAALGFDEVERVVFFHKAL